MFWEVFWMLLERSVFICFALPCLVCFVSQHSSGRGPVWQEPLPGGHQEEDHQRAEETRGHEEPGQQHHLLHLLSLAHDWTGLDLISLQSQSDPARRDLKCFQPRIIKVMETELLAPSTDSCWNGVTCWGGPMCARGQGPWGLTNRQTVRQTVKQTWSLQTAVYSLFIELPYTNKTGETCHWRGPLSPTHQCALTEHEGNVLTLYYFLIIL